MIKLTSVLFHTLMLKLYTKVQRLINIQCLEICVVLQIRNSCKYIFYKDKKEFAADMKNIYNAPNKEVAATELDNLEKK